MQPVRHDTPARTLALDQNDQAIGVAGKAVSPALHLLVELVQQGIRQQWPEWPPWGVPTSLTLDVPTDQHTGAQVGWR